MLALAYGGENSISLSRPLRGVVMRKQNEQVKTAKQRPRLTAFDLHIDLSRTYYAFSQEQLARLKTASNSLWQNLFLVSSSLSLPALCNALIEFRRASAPVQVTGAPVQVTDALFLNALVGLTTLCLSIAFGIAWRYAARTKRDVISTVEEFGCLAVTTPDTAQSTRDTTALETAYAQDTESRETTQTEYH